MTLAKVGRHMLNLKLNLGSPLDVPITTVEDGVGATRKLTDLKEVSLMSKKPGKTLVRF